MKCLELFSGTHSVGKVLESQGHSVISLDLKDATINTNILDWDYTEFPKDHFDYIHASPPCDTFSLCRKSWIGRELKAHKGEVFTKELLLKDQEEIGVPILNKTLEIIKYYNPKYFTIENPQTGYLKSQSFMNTLSYNDVDYCKYGMPYRKRTRIWNNLRNWTPRPLCKKDCNSMVGNRHICIAQHAKATSDKTGSQQRFKQSELYVIPEELVIEILNSIRI